VDANPCVKEDTMFGYGWCGGMGVGGWLLMALLWGGLLAVVVWAVIRLFPRARPGARSGESATPGSGESAASVLDRQLAAGEIDEDTYRRRRGELTGAR
jgi:putative membrane protein